MMENNYTKFGKNVYDDKGEKVYDYVAYDENNDCVLSIRFHSPFRTDFPVQIDITVASNYEHTSTAHLEITAQEFWTTYKHAVLKQYEYLTANVVK